TASAQSSGVVSGTITALVDGVVVARVTVEVKNVATGSVFSTQSGEDGKYSLPGLAPGQYELSASLAGMWPFNASLNLVTAQTLRLDIRLEDVQLNTIGESREDIARKKPTPPSGPTPRTPDGKPDLSGLWLGFETRDAGKPEPLPWAAA